MAILKRGKPKKRFIKPKNVMLGWQNAYQEILASSHNHVLRMFDKGVNYR